MIFVEQIISAVAGFNPWAGGVMLIATLIGGYFFRRLGIKIAARRFEQDQVAGAASAAALSDEVAQAKIANEEWLKVALDEIKIEPVEGDIPLARIFAPRRVVQGVPFEFGIECRVPQLFFLKLNKTKLLLTLNFARTPFIIEEVTLNELGSHVLGMNMPDGSFVSVSIEVVKG